MTDYMNFAVTIAPWVRLVINTTGEGKEHTLISAEEKIEEKLIELGLAHYRNCLPWESTIHPDNRKKSGCEPSDSQSLAAFFVKKAFSFKYANRWKAFEKAVDAIVARRQEDYNLRLIRNSDELLPDQRREDMRLLFVGGTHSSTAMRSIHFGAATIFPHLADDNGNFDKKKIIETQSTMKKPLEDGVPTLVFRPEVEVVLPELPAFLSEAGNDTHGSERHDTTAQILQSLHGRILAERRKAEPASVEEMAARIENEKPEMKGQAADLIRFVTKYSGGTDPIHLMDIDAFSKTLRNRHNIPAAILRVLHGVKLMQSELFIIAMYKAAMCCPPEAKWVHGKTACYGTQPTWPDLRETKSNPLCSGPTRPCSRRISGSRYNLTTTRLR